MCGALPRYSAGAAATSKECFLIEMAIGNGGFDADAGYTSHSGYVLHVGDGGGEKIVLSVQSQSKQCEGKTSLHTTAEATVVNRTVADLVLVRRFRIAAACVAVGFY